MKDIEPKIQENDEEMLDAEDLPPPARGILYERPQAKHAYVVVLCALLCLAFSLIFWFSESYADLLWASRESIFERHQYWRLFTALFTHSDFTHLISNLPLFVIFGWLLRTYFGLSAFPCAALLVGAMANYATLYFYPSNLRLIGASGMVYGLVGLWITFYLRYEIRYSLSMKLFRVVGFSMVLLLPTTYHETTSYLAHGFGFLLGILFALALLAAGIYDNKQRALQRP